MSTVETNDNNANLSQLYYPYGGKRSTGSVATPYRYTGQRWEDALGLYFYQARWYDPALGRFIQPDSIVPEPGNPQALNRYSYCLNNPVRYSDPSGHWPGWTDVVRGAAFQFVDDMTLGLAGLGYQALYGMSVDLVEEGSDQFQLGRELGRAVATGVSEFETATGLGMAAAGASAGPITMAAAAAGAPASGGITLIGGTIILTAEGVMVVGGTAIATHGTAVLLRMAGKPLSSPRMLGANGPRVMSKTVWQGKRGRLDIENPSPGKRPGQIHFQEWGDNGHKWLYNPEANSFLPEMGTGVEPPGWLLDMLNDNDFVAGIQKGLKYLGEQ